MRVPTGSLVRVVGTELVIPCNVSDYDGPSEQNFDWSFSSSGSSFVELASTWEAGFPAQLYRERLQRGEIDQIHSPLLFILYSHIYTVSH